MKDIFRYCKIYTVKHRGSIALYAILCVIAGFLSLAIPYISGSFIDFLTIGTDKNQLFKYCLLFGFMSTCGLLIGYTVNRQYTKLLIKLSYDVNKDVVSHLQKVSALFFTEKNVSYLNQRINNDSNTVISFYLQTIESILINSIKIIFPFAYLALTNRYVVAIAVGAILFLFSGYKHLRGYVFKCGYDYKEKQSLYFSKLNEQLENLRFVKSHGIEESFLMRLAKSFGSLFISSLKYQNASYAFSGLETIITTIAQIGLYIVCGIQVMDKKMTIGEFTILSTYFALIIGASRYYFGLGKSVQDTKISYMRLTELFNIDVIQSGNIVPECIDTVSFNRCSFSYGSKPIIHNFSYTFHSGNVYVIRGKNGSGKTTLISLVLGLFGKNYNGEILVNGLPIQDINQHILNQKFVAIYEQEPILFNDSIMYNLTLCDNNQSDKINLILMLAQKLNADNLIKSLLEDDRKKVGENGSNLSSGEKSKIALIRTFLQDSDVIILDEPTAYLDTTSVEMFKLYIEEVKKSKLLLIITHDDALMDLADCILDAELLTTNQ